MSADQVKDLLMNTSFTLQGRMFFPKLFTPEATKSGRLQYKLLFSWGFNTNTQETQRIGAFIAQFKQRVFPTIPDNYFVNPIKKWGVYQRQDGKPMHEFLKDSYWLNANSGADFPPVIVDEHRQPIVNQADVYSGRNCVVNISFFKIDNDKKGLGTNIKAVMLMPGGDQVAGASSVDVDKVFGGFQADMGSAPMENQGGYQASQEQQQMPQQQQWPPQQQGQAPQQQQQQQQMPQQNNNGGNGFV